MEAMIMLEKRIGYWLLVAALANGVALGAIHAAPPDAARRAELIDLLQQDCGACHGMRLKGGLGPALTPRALSRLSPKTIVATILDGRPGTPMPPWRPFIDPDEAAWLANQLKAGIHP